MQNLNFDELQTAVEIALVDEFWRNLCQMKGLGLIFQKNWNFWFLSIIQCFTPIWTWPRSWFLGISKNTKNELF